MGVDGQERADDLPKTVDSARDAAGGGEGEVSEIGRRLMRAARERGWSQQQLSDRAGLGRNAVNEIINRPDRTPRRTTLTKLARALGVDPEWLIHGDPSPAAGGSTEKPLTAEEIRGADPTGALGALADMVASTADRWSVWRIAAPAGDPFGAVRLALVDHSRTPRTGDHVVSPGRGLRYLVEPYLVGTTATGAMDHSLRGDTDAGGVVVLIVTPEGERAPRGADPLEMGN